MKTRCRHCHSLITESALRCSYCQALTGRGAWLTWGLGLVVAAALMGMCGVGR